MSTNGLPMPRGLIFFFFKLVHLALTSVSMSRSGDRKKGALLHERLLYAFRCSLNTQTRTQLLRIPVATKKW